MWDTTDFVVLMVDKSDCGHQTLNTSGHIHDMAKVSWAKMKYFYGTFKLCTLFSKNVSLLLLWQVLKIHRKST